MLSMGNKVFSVDCQLKCYISVCVCVCVFRSDCTRLINLKVIEKTECQLRTNGNDFFLLAVSGVDNYRPSQLTDYGLVDNPHCQTGSMTDHFIAATNHKWLSIVIFVSFTFGDR